MALATQRISLPPSGFATAANTRFGDGVRASSGPSTFTPVSATEGIPEVLIKDQGLRNDDWAYRRGEDTASQGPEDHAVDAGRVFFKMVFISNLNARTLFFAGYEADEDGILRPANENMKAPDWRGRATRRYQINTSVLEAAYRGQALMGGGLDRFL